MKELRWDLASIYANDDLARDEIKKIEEKLEEVKKLKSDSKSNLVQLLLKEVEISRKLYKLGAYSHMKKDEDSNVTNYQKLDKEVSNLSSKISTEFAFLTPLLLSLDEKEIKELKNREELKEFDVYLNKIFRYKAHTLSDKEELVMSTLSSTLRTSANMYYFLTNTDMKFPYLEKWDKELTNTNFVNIQMNEDRELRKEAFKKFYDTFNQYGNTIAQSYYSHIDGLGKISKLRNYDSIREMFLFRDDVSTDVYDALVQSIHDNLPYLHKYYEIKKRALKLDEQHMYDVYMPMTSNFEKQYTFEEAKELVIESVKPMGEEYVNNYKKAFEENWIDVEPRPGKRNGAYSSGSYDTKPFILLNFDGTLSSVFTLAHEMGHSLHSYYDRSTNDFLHSGYTIFVAEVASTFNEALLLDLLMKKAESEEELLYLTDFYVNNYKSTVFRQTMFAEFEREVHHKIENGIVLTKDDFSNIYLELNKKYFGDAMVSDKEIAYEWMRIPHFYSNFYVYKYAIGFTASSILVRRVLEGVENARENYIKFLKDGDNHFPIEQLKIAGVDMSKPETVNKSLETFRELVDKLDKMIK
ncbi:MULTISPECIES: oligoendopeptidase F [Helcococcus]|uniref:Oligopeptidase F n=1 Tax=Helcococcus bovis TaxID=3153252 RepID=A0ABW9F6J8_9FIRM